MTTNIINISTKNSIIFRNNKRLKVLLSIQNFSNICHSNQTPICDFNRFIFESISSKPNLSGNRWLRKSNFVSINSTIRSMSQSLDTTYERIADQTLEHLYEEFEAIMEEIADKDTDVSLSSGVLTLKLGLNQIYVINKQSPNKQIWFSSPVSGPKRYDYVNNEWIYKRDGKSLFHTLSSELSVILKRDIKIKSFSQ